MLARASCGSVKLTRVGESMASERLLGLLAEVQLAAGIRLEDVSSACAGLSGISIDELRNWADRLLCAVMPNARVLLCGDEQIALDAAFHGGPGILVVGGTGSNVVGRCGDGRRFTAGGWGAAVGDEGSGYWIGAQALRATFHALDRGVETTLLASIGSAWGLAGPGEIVAYANTQPWPDFSALTPLIVRAAEAGDAVAKAVLAHAGQALAEQVKVVWERMQAAGEQTAQVAYTGSVLEWIAPVRQAMIAALPPGLAAMDAPAIAMEGAMWLARNPSGTRDKL